MLTDRIPFSVFLKLVGLAFCVFLLALQYFPPILAIARKKLTKLWQQTLALAIPVAMSSAGAAAYLFLPHTIDIMGPAVILFALVSIGWAAFMMWLALFNTCRRPVSIRDIARNPDGFDSANLEGAVSAHELWPSGLLVSGQPLVPRPKGGKDLDPQEWAWPAQEAHPDRVILGRFYDARGATAYFVAPHIKHLNQTLIVAPPGSGKTFSFALPWSVEFPRAGHSAFVVDVKGNLYGKVRAQLATEGYGVFHFDPMHPSESLHWNPFDEINRDDYNSHAFYQTANDLAEAIFGKINPGDSEHWDTLDQRAIKAGVVLLCLTHDNPTLRDLYELFDDENTLKTALDFLEQRAKGEASLDRHVRDIRRDLDFLFTTRRRGFPEAVSGIRNRLEILGSPAVATITDRSEGFSLGALTEKPGLFVCATPLALGRVGMTLAAIIIRMIARMMVNRFSADQPRKLFLILDEFSKLQMSHNQVEQFISTSREAGCVSVVFLQDVTQVDRQVRGALLANCKDRFILRGVGTETAKWGVDLLGERVRYQVSMGSSTNYSPGQYGIPQRSDGDSLNVTEQTVPVLRPREIMACGGLRWGAWAILSDYCPKPILIDMTR